jgi:hypothetical protein
MLVEEAYHKAMASWRGNVSEETMSADLKAAMKAVLDEAATAVALDTSGLNFGKGLEAETSKAVELLYRIKALD